MPRFDLLTVDLATGTRRRVSLSAPDRTAARNLAATSQTGVLRVRQSRATPRVWESSRTQRELALSARAIATLLNAGLPFPAALQSAATALRSPLSEQWLDVRRSVIKGEPISAAMTEGLLGLSPYYKSVVAAADASGRLADGFDHLATYMEKSQNVKSQIARSLMYPALLAVGSTATSILIITSVIPKFAAMITEAGSELPGTTAVLLALSQAIADHRGLLLISLMLIIGVITAGMRTASGRRLFAKAFLSCPGIGPMRRQHLSGRLARTLSLMLQGNIPLQHCLNEIAQTEPDPEARLQIHALKSRILHGDAFDAAIRQSSIYDGLLTEFATIGVRSGELSRFTSGAADALEDRLISRLSAAAALIEPGIIMAMGSLTAWIAIALLQAVYSISPGAL